MKEWNYAFDPVSKADWLKQAEKDLKGTSLESLESEWWPGEKLNPIHFAEDLQQHIISLPDRFFIQPPSIMEWIDTSIFDGTTIQNNIKRALEYGAQTIVLNVSENINADYDVWLDGVFTEMIDIEINISSENSIPVSAIITSAPARPVIRLNRGNESSSDFLIDAIHDHDHSFHFVYAIDSEGNWIKNTVDVFKKIQSDLSHWMANNREALDFFNACILMIVPDHIYFKQIIQTRALQLVWIQLLTRSGQHADKIDSIIECHILGHEMMDPDQYLIRTAASTLGASLTGVKSICIHHSDKNDLPNYYQRVNRNIHHLLSLESGIYKGVDPVSGSYSVDFYTKKWTEEILESLQNK
ncbi:MAG TPA: methylmalonyl-CoA mutase family protein [Saprospiraceae bacterium]|nr:methylmalonyl-CoA mutase family protein [Saprospiraceae bacterium]